MKRPTAAPSSCVSTAKTRRCEPSVICGWPIAAPLICSRTAGAAMTRPRNGCKPKEVGARANALQQVVELLVRELLGGVEALVA